MEQDEIVALGSSLRQINQKILKRGQENGTKRVWYQGEEPYFDVFFELQNDDILWFQFTLRGKSLSWDGKHPGVQTGTTNELKVDDVPYYPASKTIQTDNKPDLKFVNLVQSIMQTKTQEAVFAKALALLNSSN